MNMSCKSIFFLKLSHKSRFKFLCYVSMQNLSNAKYVTVTFAEGTQKNLEEALKDAEKYLK